jgi:hypothetical protein
MRHINSKGSKCKYSKMYKYTFHFVGVFLLNCEDGYGYPFVLNYFYHINLIFTLLTVSVIGQIISTFRQIDLIHRLKGTVIKGILA